MRMISFVSHLCSRGKVVRAHGCRVEGAATAARRDVVAALSKRQGAGQVAPSPENLRAGTGGEEEESPATSLPRLPPPKGRPALNRPGPKYRHV